MTIVLNVAGLGGLQVTAVREMNSQMHVLSPGFRMQISSYWFTAWAFAL